MIFRNAFHHLQYIYADDTEIQSCGDSVSEFRDHLDNITKWFFENKLTVNDSKSYCMLSSSNRNILLKKLNGSITDVSTASELY